VDDDDRFQSVLGLVDEVDDLVLVEIGITPGRVHFSSKIRSLTWDEPA
jgi:hypothetical protein